MKRGTARRPWHVTGGRQPDAHDRGEQQCTDVRVQGDGPIPLRDRSGERGQLAGVGPRADPQADRKTMLPRSGPEAGTTKEVAWSEKDRLTWAESVTVATPAHPPRARL